MVKPKIPRWTYQEEQYLIDNYNNKTIQQLADYYGRHYGAVARKIYDMQQKGTLQYKYTKPKKKANSLTRSRKGLKKVNLTECPECGSSRINKLDLSYKGVNYFCVNCLKEFDKYGLYVEPVGGEEEG